MSRRPAQADDTFVSVNGEHTLRRMRKLGIYRKGIDDHLTGAELWTRAVEAGFVVDDRGGVITFEDYRFMKRALRQEAAPHPDQMLRRAAETLRGGSITTGSVSALLGEVSSEDTNRVRLMAGQVDRRSRLVGRHGMDPAHLLALFPDDLRASLTAALTEECIPAIVQPSRCHTRRVMELQAPWNLLGAATLLRGAVRQMSSGSMSAYVGIICDYARLLAGASTTAEVEQQMNDHMDASENDRIAPSTRAGRVLKLFGIVSCGAEFVDSYAPAQNVITDSFKGVQLSQQLKTRLTDIEMKHASGVEVERDQRTVVRLAFEGQLRHAVDNRFGQVIRLYDHFVIASTELAQSGNPSLTFEVREPCILLNGQLGSGEQFSRYRVCTGRHAGELAIKLQGKRDAAKYPFFHEDRRAKCRPDEEFVLLYEGCEPVDRASQCEDPYFVEMFRWGMFDAYRTLPSSVRRICVEQCAAWGYTPTGRVLAGLLTVPRDLHFLANVFRQSNADGAPVLLPIARFAHAILIGRTAASFSEDTGPRASEILQVKPEGLGSRDIAGRKIPLFWSRPKWGNKLVARDISPSTLRLIARLRRMVIARFGGDERDDRGRIAVPTRNFQGARHALCPPSRYLIQTAGAGMRITDLNTCLRALVAGLCEISIHEERFVFTTKADMANFGKRALRKMLAYRSDSEQFKHYSAAGIVRSTAADRNLFGAIKATPNG